VDARDVAEQTEAYIRNHFAINPRDDRFGPGVDLFEGGYVDSVGLAELLEFIQDEFGVVIPDEDLLSDDFATIEGIALIVCRHRIV
jgi:methoxymalonate biosynthesis acyl carrier protein